MKRATFAKQLDAFLKTEGALAYATMSSRDGKLIHGTGYLFASGDSQAMPGFEIAAEDYRRLARLAKVGPAPVVEMTSVVHYDDSDSKASNIIAEIHGREPTAGEWQRAVAGREVRFMMNSVVCATSKKKHTLSIK